MNNLILNLPHSGVMVLIDKVVSVDKESACTKSIIKDCVFVENGKFDSYQIIEIMAQTLGIYKNYHEKNNSSRIAFLVGSRKFNIYRSFLNIGEEIEIIAKLSMQDENGFGLYDCQAWCGNELVANAVLSVLNPDKEMFEELKNA